MDQEVVNFFQQLPPFDEANPEVPASSSAQNDDPGEFRLPSDDEQSWVLGGDQELPETESDQQSGEDPYEQLRADYERIQQENQQYAARMGQYEAQMQQQAAADAARQWDQLEQQAIAYARTLDYEQAINYMAWFGQQRNEAVRTQASQIVQNATTQMYADHIMKQYGLNDEDRIMLGNDARNFAAIAERIQRERQEIDRRFQEVQAKVKNTRLSNQSSQRIASNADRMGTPGRTVPPDWTKLSPEDQLRAMWGVPISRR